jgi:hypothetical protein
MRLRSLAAVIAALAALSGCGRESKPVPASPSPMSVTPITAPSPSPLPDPLPEVLATVDGRPVPLRSARIIAQQSFAGRTPSDAERATAYRLALEQLIARELLYQEAVRRKIAPDAGAVQRLREQVRSEHKTGKAWKEFLSVQGLDEKSLVEELRVRSMVETVLRQETLKVPDVVSDDEARAYYSANPNIFESAGRPVPFESVRDRITTQLVTFKRSEALNTLLTRLRASSKIETFI